MKNKTQLPPSWCPEAVASDRGWRHPITGELLVSVRGGVPSGNILDLPNANETISEVVEADIINETIATENIILDAEPDAVIVESVKSVSKPKRKGKNV